MNGIVTVLNTPFTSSSEIDLDGLRHNVSNAMTAGVSGFLVGGLASEVGVLTGDERVAILEAVIEISDGLVPVIGGAFGEKQRERIDVARRLIDSGCNGVMASIPFTNETEFESDVRGLSELKPDFLMIQDWDPAGCGIPVPTITRLYEAIPAFTWLKIEVIPAGPKYAEVLKATKGELRVAGGWAVMQMIEALDRGVHAFMPTAMHRIYTTIYERYTAGDRDGARELFEAILPVLAFSNQSLDISILFFKRLLAAQGVFETSMIRVSCPPFDDAQVRIADELITKVMSIEDSLES